jgi:cytochrome c oxidase cbb3-type subunit 2
MNKGPVIFLGLFFIMAWSFYGIIGKNFQELGRQDPVRLDTGEAYPGGRPGLAAAGQDVYRANGCASCHTMQVRMKGFGRDIERGWGARNTVLQDFVYDQHVFLGQTRIGPDLASVGARLPDRTYHLLHLYNPRTVVPDSMMPQYPYLFIKKRIKGQRSPEALPLPPKFQEEGYEVIPTAEAKALVEYLVSLRANTFIFEAPQLPPPPPATAPAKNPGATAAAAPAN